ncbi:MAG TPA: L-seryl-tRNA(Sec) selenium transferase [Anaerolineae bacterium]|nr:L-seryl-tRNA(Sec) selenium transferase [Anaerolineae bacterium]HIP74002.1 L-seryl-tRNA(Sec) selenium transferase [Anaerolineae bacterium]
MSEDSLAQALLRGLPSVDKLLQSTAVSPLLAEYGRNLTVKALRHSLEQTRAAILSEAVSEAVTDEMIVAAAVTWLNDFLAPTLYPVINGAGVIVHTNLGRAPLSRVALAAMQAVGQGYSTLEYDVAAGNRGSRAVHAEQLLQRLTGAEAALVVNNNASSVLLMLTALCQGREVIISRGQLVEIGGGFRIPDVMIQSGAKLVEVGTTNRTHLRDYANAINENTAAILVAHHSNYRIIGFHTEPELADLAALAHERGLPLLYDQGSGAFLDTAVYGLEHEPTVLEGLEAGCDIVAFSGDKLLGGPQAGILSGRTAYITPCKKHPLARAVRADKMCLAGLSATLTQYLTGRALTEIPVWRMIARPLAEIEAEANAWAARLQEEGVAAEVVDGRSTVGGGSLPGTSLPTKLLALSHANPDKLAETLRLSDPPVIGRIQDGRFLIDPRTIFPEQVDILLETLLHCAMESTTD